MSKFRDKQLEVMSLIDQVLTAIEAAPQMNINLDHVDISLNPTGLLLNLLMKVVDREKLFNWLVEQLTVSLPWIELGVKGVFLSLLKSTIDCANDPRIPLHLREASANDIEVTNANIPIPQKNERGFYVGIDAIDYKNILRQSPLDKDQVYYFGTSRFYTLKNDETKEKFNTFYDAYRVAKTKSMGIDDIERHGCETIHELCRAKDMNAFLWYVKNQARYQNTIKWDEDKWKDWDLDLLPQTIDDKAIPSVGSIVKKNNRFSIVAKRSITYQEDNTNTDIPQLIEQKHSDLILPYYSSVDETDGLGKRITWYNRKPNIEQVFQDTENRSKRKDTDNTQNEDYTDNIPMLIFECEQNGTTDIQKYGSQGGFKVQILRKPLTLGPWRMLFNDKGEAKGSRYERRFTVIPTSLSTDTITAATKIFNNIKDAISKGSNDIKKVEKPISIGIKNGTLEISQGGNIAIKPNGTFTKKDCLVECYPNLTIYEFNYDYLMGLRLFDPKSMAQSLLDIACGIQPMTLDGNIRISRNETEYQMRIAALVDKIMNQSEDAKVSDCFFSFSNDEYEKLSREAELKRANLYSFVDYDTQVVQSDAQEVLDILNQYNEDGTLEENVEVLTRAFTTGVPSIKEEVLPEDRYAFEGQILGELLKNFVVTIVQSLLSPKVLLLLEMNKQLMLEKNVFSTNPKELLESMIGFLSAIIMEVVDMVLRLMLNLLLDTLRDLFIQVHQLLLKEQLERYTKILRQILDVCSFSLSHRKALDTQLDDVSGAEIEISDKPLNEEC